MAQNARPSPSQWDRTRISQPTHRGLLGQVYRCDPAGAPAPVAVRSTRIWKRTHREENRPVAPTWNYCRLFWNECPHCRHAVRRRAFSVLHSLQRRYMALENQLVTTAQITRMATSPARLSRVSIFLSCRVWSGPCQCRSRRSLAPAVAVFSTALQSLASPELSDPSALSGFRQAGDHSAGSCERRDGSAAGYGDHRIRPGHISRAEEASYDLWKAGSRPAGRSTERLHVNVDAVCGVSGFERLPKYRGSFLPVARDLLEVGKRQATTHSLSVLPGQRHEPLALAPDV